MPLSLQKKLTLSHLTVTIISVFILNILIFGAYLLYLQTSLVAHWAGVEAAYLADDIVWVMEGDPLEPEIAREFVVSSGLVNLLDQHEQLLLEPEEDDWLIIFDPNYVVYASNDHDLFPPGMTVTPDQLPGFSPPSLQPAWYGAFLLAPDLPFSYAVTHDAHIGQAPILDEAGQLIGWIYFRSVFFEGPFTSTETLIALAVFLLGATLVATVISGLAGAMLARSFGRRLNQLSTASVKLAGGDLTQRVPVHGAPLADGDEIDQLGVHFNAMAEKLADQLAQLRALANHNAMLAEEAHALAALEERSHLARELHDAVKQQVFGLSLTAGSIRQLLDKDPPLAKERLIQLERQARDIHQEMDSIIRHLRPAALQDQGLAAALRQLIGNQQKEHVVPINLTITGERTIPLVVAIPSPTMDYWKSETLDE